MAHEYPDCMRVILPDEYLIEIGKVSAQWSMFETILNFALTKLCGMRLEDPTSAIIFAHMTFPQKSDVLSSLVHQLTPAFPHLEVFDEVSKQITKAQKGRNKIMHGLWGMNEETEKVTVSRLSARGKLKPTEEEMSLSNLRSIPTDIGTASSSLLKMIVNR